MPVYSSFGTEIDQDMERQRKRLGKKGSQKLKDFSTNSKGNFYQIIYDKFGD